MLLEEICFQLFEQGEKGWSLADPDRHTIPYLKIVSTECLASCLLLPKFPGLKHGEVDATLCAPPKVLKLIARWVFRVECLVDVASDLKCDAYVQWETRTFSEGQFYPSILVKTVD